jgi:serine/threonine protein kinase
MAEVFLATCNRPELQNQFIAVKKLHAPLNANKPFVNLLVHEAKIGVLLAHPGIAEVFDLGSHQSEFFLAMEYIHGKSLDKILAKVREETCPLPSRDVATFILFEVLRALAFAHALKDVKGRELNIVHRDVSPGNILLEYKGNVKLTDFGIATAENRLQVELSHVALGKLVYIPPEQAVNDPVVCASDLYSLSAVYYELLTGRLPFESESPSGLYKKIVEGKAADIRSLRPEIPRELSDLIHKNLDKSARKRFQSAPEMFSAFQKYFLEKENLDFNSRATRAYFKKKLAEYLRKCFEAEIIEELEIIQEALMLSEREADLGDTRPQEIPPEMLLSEINQVDEATVLEPDHTNEATRHYPLTEEERKKILMGLPPKEVIQENQNFENLSPAEFEQATIPDFKTTQGQRVKDKLQNISINKDEREVLRHSEPAFEIKNSEDLETFEQNTLSGRAEKTIILGEDLVPTREQEAPEYREASPKISAADEPTPQGLTSGSLSLPIEDKDKNLKRERAFSQTIQRFFAPGIALLLLLGIAWGVYQNWPKLVTRAESLYHQLILSSQTFKPSPLVPSQQIALLLTGEADFQTQKDISRDLQFSDNYSVHRIESFFNQAHEKHTGKKGRVLALVPTEPRINSRPMAFLPDLSQRLESGEIFFDLEREGIQHRDPFNSSIVIYVYQDSVAGASRFPDEFSGRRYRSTGLVFFNAQKESRISLLVKIAREISRLHGAQDRIEPGTLLPKVPSGLAAPQKNPLLPQERAELMGRWILLDSLQKREVNSLDEMLIGAETAKELGWSHTNSSSKP